MTTCLTALRERVLHLAARRPLLTLAREMQVSRNTLSAWVAERGEQRVTVRTLQKIETWCAQQHDAQALREANDVAHQIVATSRDPLLVLTPGFRVQCANPAFYALFQVRPTDTEGQSLYQLGNGQWDIPEFHTLLEDILPRQTVFNDYEVTHTFERIGRRTIVLNARRLDHVQLILLAMEDITARQQRQQGQKMEALGTLAGGIAHDFNNILATILGYTELAQYDLALDNPVRPTLQKALLAIQRGKALVQQILAFSHGTPLERTPVSLADVIRDTLPLVRALLPATIALEVQLTSAASVVLANPTQMQQIVLNLGANAEYAMRATGGSLAVHLEAVEVDAGVAAPPPALRPGPYVRLTVRDSGSGIPPAVLARMFEPFFTTKEVGQGTGLGLSIVHGIVESHGGTILVESTLGQGTTFTIYLPRLAPGVEGDAQE